MYIYDIKTLRISAINEVFTEQFGYSEESALLMTVYDLFPESERDALKKNVQNSKDAVRSKETGIISDRTGRQSAYRFSPGAFYLMEMNSEQLSSQMYLI